MVGALGNSGRTGGAHISLDRNGWLLLPLSEDVSANQAVRIYRLRVALLRTSPHGWRRMLVRSSYSFGWSADHPCRFLSRGRSFSDNNSAASPLLSEFAFTTNERFLYDVRFRDAQALMPVWRHQVGLETILAAGPSDSFIR
ncbi:MAG: plasmid pRiA4b ORF-3 family protein [Nitrospira sp.]|nr:plasmid pRiA4b ORF-3 family protein [Nitrospira sp.]MDH4341584.1 plasmid pRiA4b ORF-3 family protein [Nitrospira sp.]MDH5336645.1 plasmid pRiA4b ORF-3 family protein [Nitrospira sp.]